MKKNLILLGVITALIFGFASCNSGPEADAEKLMSKFENFTKELNTAAEDGKLDEKEIESIKKLSKEIEEFSSKYENDAENSEKFEKFFKDNEEKYKKIMTDFFSAITKASQCEGAENLDF